MSMFSVDIIHTETIKPSMPTPPHLNTLKLSVMDQLEEPLYIPQILFYSATARTATLDHLKKSLSQTLTLFYPFAGRIIDNRYIHCNDRGINFFQTRVNTQMENVLINPIADYLLPFAPNHDKLDPTALVSVQINIFDCGGMALCAYITHQITDTSSLVFFLNTWAAITRGASSDELIRPKFCAASLFPPAESDVPEIISSHGTQETFISKRFVFRASDIAALQAKCSHKQYRATRVEAVTAYLWRCAMNSAGATSSVAMPTVNLRTRMDPPLSIAYVGNLIFGLLATAATKGLPDLRYLAGQLHEEIKKIDGDYVRKLQADHGVLKVYDSYKEKPIELCSGGEPARFFAITSFCRFPFYEADFGWGKPDWVTILNLVCPDVIMLMDTKCGTGIEAWVTLNEQRMAKFECNPDLVVLTSKL